MTHTGYTIQMKIKNITIHLRDGSSLLGQVFVSEYSRQHAGPEKISEYFENEYSFFPFKIGNDLILFSKAFVSFVEFEPEDDISIYNKIAAEIILSDGTLLHTTIPILVPNPSARLSDQINSPEKFLLCEISGNKNHVLVNKSHLFSIKEKR